MTSLAARIFWIMVKVKLSQRFF